MRPCGGCGKMVEDDNEGAVRNVDTAFPHVCPDRLSRADLIRELKALRDDMATLQYDGEHMTRQDCVDALDALIRRAEGGEQ